jgi:hypothetical protein
MLVIWLLELNYRKYKITIAPKRNAPNKMFFSSRFFITSNPFAIIIHPGIKKKIISDSFLSRMSRANTMEIIEFTIKIIQLFLNKLLIENTLGDFMSIESRVKNRKK